MEPGRNRELYLPADISRWTTEQVLKYISRRSEHAAGDLILGNESYGRYLESAAAQEASVIPDQRRGAFCDREIVRARLQPPQPRPRPIVPPVADQEIALDQRIEKVR